MMMIARKSLVIFFSSIYTSITELILYFIAVRMYLPQEFDKLQLANSVFAFFLFFSDLNFAMIHAKKMSEKQQDESKYFSTYVLIKGIFFIVASVVTVIIIVLFIGSGQIIDTQVQVQLLLIMFIATTFQSLNLLYSSSLQAKMEIVKMQMALVVGHSIRFIFGIVVLVLGMDIVLYTLSYFFAKLSIFLIYCYFCRKMKLVKPEKVMITAYFKFGSIVLVYQVANIFISNFGPIAFASYFNSGHLGIFFIFNQILMVISLLENAFRTLFLPNFSNAIATREFDKLKANVMKYEKYMLVITGLIIIVSFSAGSAILRQVLGDFYVDNGITYFYMATYSTFISALWVPHITLMVATEDKRMLLIALSGIGFSIVSWIFLIPLLGIIGLNIGSWFAAIPNLLIARSINKKRFGIGRIEKFVYIIFILGTVLGILSLYMKQFFEDNIFFIVLFTFLIIFAFLGMLFALRVLSKEDIRYLLSVINPRSFMREIKTELKDAGEPADSN